MTSDRQRVLIVDDQSDFRDAASDVLGLVDAFEVVAVGDAESALTYTASHEVDLVLIDVHMPGLGGVEGARRLRQRNAAVLIVLMSTYDPDDLPSDVESSGLQYIHKESLDADVLLAMCESHRTATGE